jgi:arsenate reductase
MQKTFAWFNNHNIAFTFHDYKKEGVNTADLDRWANKVDWKNLINRSGQTWKKQSAALQQSIVNQDAAFLFMVANSSVIKRPIIEFQDTLILGFNEALLIELFKI